MRKTFLLFSIIFLVLTFGASAQLLLEENFDYSADALLTDNGWTAHSGVGSNAITVVSPGLTFANYPSSDIGNAALLDNTGEDVNRLFTEVSSSAVYAAFNFKVSAIAAGYFIHLAPNPQNNDFRARLWISGSGTDVRVGLSFASSDTVFSTETLLTDSTYLAVLKYEIVDGDLNDVVSLHIFGVEDNIPMVEPAPTVGPIANATTSADINPGSINLRQFSGSQNITVDGIRIATSWAEAVTNFLTIAEAIEDLNSDLMPDRIGETVTIQGTVISPNYQTSNHSYYVWDGTAGITEILFGTTTPVWNLGDEVIITGEIGQFRGLTQIVPVDTNGIATLSSGNPVPDPVILTVAEYTADPEAYEGTLVAFANLTKVGGTWPASGSATLQFTDGTDTVDIRIDSDTNIDGQPEPTYPVDILGMGGQFSSGTSVVNDGYQILPRYYETDFLPGGTVPVELVSFNAAVSGKGVSLKWTTATETNNSGFEVERSSDNKSFQKIGFVGGHGTTSEKSSYSFADANAKAGKNYYRLKQIDFDGTFAYSNSVMIDVNLIKSYQLAQNFPNPFNPSTTISFALPVDAKITVKIFNILGKEVANVVNDKLAAGEYNYSVNMSNLTSGVYFYNIKAVGIDGSAFNSTKKMTLMK